MNSNTEYGRVSLPVVIGIAAVAAAVGAHLVTVFGVTDARRTGPWSPRAINVGSDTAWPSASEVATAVYQQLSSE